MVNERNESSFSYFRVPPISGKDIVFIPYICSSNCFLPKFAF